jgi:hypothetical protein
LNARLLLLLRLAAAALSRMNWPSSWGRDVRRSFVNTCDDEHEHRLEMRGRSRCSNETLLTPALGVSTPAKVEPPASKVDSTKGHVFDKLHASSCFGRTTDCLERISVAA